MSHMEQLKDVDFKTKPLLLCLLFFFIAMPLFAVEEIVVEVKTTDQLVPLYLAPISTSKSGFEANYCKQIGQVLQFDFEHNGRTALLPTNPEREQLSQRESFDTIAWRKAGAQLFIHPSLNDKRLILTVLDTRTTKVKKLNEVTLSGNLAHDRKLIHQASDTIFLSLFNEEGIASRRILYTLRTKGSSNNSQDWVTEVWEADYDFANQRKLTTDHKLCVTPSYVPLPNGQPHDFVYVSYKIGQPKIYLGSTKGGESRRLSYLRGNQLMPVISPRLNKLAFINDITGNPDLFIQDFSVEKGLIGKPEQIFHAPGATQGCPSFSPDGFSITFVSNKDGTPRIYMMPIPRAGASLKDLKPQLISKKNQGNTSPAWSPDGKKIAYSAVTSGVRQIWIYDIVKHEEWQLTQGATHKENPMWAPNSLHLLFNSVGDGVAELYLINLNQKTATKISSGAGEKRFPAW